MTVLERGKCDRSRHNQRALAEEDVPHETEGYVDASWKRIPTGGEECASRQMCELLGRQAEHGCLSP